MLTKKHKRSHPPGQGQGWLFLAALGIVPDIPCDQPGTILLSLEHPHVSADGPERGSLDITFLSQVTIQADTGKCPVPRYDDLVDGQFLVESEILGKAVESARFADAYIHEAAGNHPHRIIGEEVEIVREAIGLKGLHGSCDKFPNGLLVIHMLGKRLRRHE